MTQRDIDVIVAGHVCLDIIPGFPPGARRPADEVFAPGRLVEVLEPIISTGGPVSNTGIPLAKLGMRTAFMTKVGGDEFGALIIEKLRRWSGHVSIAVSDSEESSYSAVLAPPGVDRIFFHCPGANNTFSSRDIDFDLCARATVFHLGYPPLMRALYARGGEELEAILKGARKRGATTSLDMALPDPSSEAGRVDWRSILKRVMPFVDLFHPSAEEGLYMLFPERWAELREAVGDEEMSDLMEEDDFVRLSTQALQWGAATVTLKAGHRGFYLHTAGRDRFEWAGAAFVGKMHDWADRQLWNPAYRLERIASATGAGDASLAGFLAACVRGESPERCIAAAGSLGYQNLQAMDATSGIRDWAATVEIMEDLTLPRYPMPDWNAWRFDNKKHIGYGPKDAAR
jgi:sugar/nucleoside kinase (ribokinase family)